LIHDFDFRGTDPMTAILQWTVNGDPRVDSWASRWMGSACLNRKLTLYPGRTLVTNTGFDGSGSHSTFGLSNEAFASPMAERPIAVGDAAVGVDAAIMKRHRQLFTSWRMRGGRATRAYYRLMPFLPAPLERAIYTRMVRRQLRRRASPAIRAALDG
jgi:hypothetical protein